MASKDLSKPLSPQQKRYCYELFIDPDRNQTKAAIRAGYSVRTAKPQASHLMRDPRIKREIARLEKEQMRRMGIDHDRILQELAKLAFANIQDYAELIEDGKSLKDLPRDQLAALTEISVDTMEKDEFKTKKIKAKMADKKAALEMIGRHLGMFKQQTEISGTLSLAQLVEQSMRVEVEQEPLPALEAPEDSLEAVEA